MSEAIAIVAEEPLRAALEVLHPALKNGEFSDRLIAAKCIGLIAGYDVRWRNADLRVDSVERSVYSDLFNPETGRTSRTFRMGGKLDVTACDSSGRLFLIDHKSTSQDVTDPNGPYWRQLAIEGQVTHYMLLEFLNRRKVDYAVWDVMRKPSISPKQIGAKDRQAIVFSKSYCSQTMTAEAIDEFAGSERETPLMYAMRLADDCTTIRPEWYFQRRQIPRLDSEVLEYAKEVWDHSQDILAARRFNRHPRNSGACLMYGSPCRFLGICSGHDSPDSSHWVKSEWVHPELIKPEDVDSRGLLTNSRIRCFQTCRRKHYFQYELGIERLDEEEREALVFGTKWHEALEAYFLELKHQQERTI